MADLEVLSVVMPMSFVESKSLMGAPCQGTSRSRTDRDVTALVLTQKKFTFAVLNSPPLSVCRQEGEGLLIGPTVGRRCIRRRKLGPGRFALGSARHREDYHCDRRLRGAGSLHHRVERLGHSLQEESQRRGRRSAGNAQSRHHDGRIW